VICKHLLVLEARFVAALKWALRAQPLHRALLIVGVLIFVEKLLLTLLAGELYRVQDFLQGAVELGLESIVLTAVPTLFVALSAYAVLAENRLTLLALRRLRDDFDTDLADERAQ